MTRRAARMLAALEDGPKTRNELYQHAGTFYLTNNAAAELRAAGIQVDCGLIDGEYVYGLRPDVLGERSGAFGGPDNGPLPEHTGGDRIGEGHTRAGLVAFPDHTQLQIVA